MKLYLPHVEIERLQRQRQIWTCRKQNSRIYLLNVVAPRYEVHQTLIFELTCPTRSDSNMPYWWQSRIKRKIKMLLI